MPRKASDKSKVDPNNEEKPTRSRTPRRTSTKRTAQQDQQAGGNIGQPNDYEKAFDNPHRERGEVF